MVPAQQTLLDTVQALVAPRPGVELLDEVLPEILAVMAEREHCTLRWLGDTIGLDTVITALLDAYGPDSLIRSLVDTGVLVELQREGWNPDSGSVATNMIRVERPRATLPLYRIAEETDRG